MPSLFDQLKESTLEWRKGGYACDEYSLIGEILAWQMESETEAGELNLKFLREPPISCS